MWGGGTFFLTNSARLGTEWVVGQEIPYVTKWPRVKSKCQVLGHLLELKKKLAGQSQVQSSEQEGGI